MARSRAPISPASVASTIARISSVSVGAFCTAAVPIFCKTKKLHCIWFLAEPSVANDPAAERRGGGKGAAVLAAA
jgi:hypothetical protein